jgi:REP element-mobilizing transposase RayT
MPDHVHLLAGLNPKGSIADMMREVKSRSSAWINKERLVRGHFQWQEGYGAFSYAKSEVPRVIQYILNQPTHHRKKTFREEYQQMLKVHGIAFDARYLFEWI